MKKLLLSLVAVLYLMLSIGFSIDVHYCMGNRLGVDFFNDSDGKCGKCGMTEGEFGCCSNQHSFYKIVDSHKQISSFDFSAPTSEAILPNVYSDFICHKYAPQTLLKPAEVIDIGAPPLYLRNRVFRI